MARKILKEGRQANGDFITKDGEVIANPFKSVEIRNAGPLGGAPTLNIVATERALRDLAIAILHTLEKGCGGCSQPTKNGTINVQKVAEAE
jgi:hypothetical protein